MSNTDEEIPCRKLIYPIAQFESTLILEDKAKNQKEQEKKGYKVAPVTSVVKRATLMIDVKESFAFIARLTCYFNTLSRFNEIM